ncbi:MAG: hypothetical protein M1281_04870 [Chloroflexi bacterium]|nr:hypothetical protein [Chloroflexota bacterium]
MGDANQELQPEGEHLEETSGRKPGWSAPKPEVLPKPTYTPMIMSFGIVFLLWGLISSWILSVVGAVLITIALVGWIGAILHE